MSATSPSPCLCTYTLTSPLHTPSSPVLPTGVKTTFMYSPYDECHAWLRDRPDSDLPNDGRLCSACPHASTISVPVPQQIRPRSTNNTQGTEADRRVSGSGPFRAGSGSEEGQGPFGCVSQRASCCPGKAGGMSLGPGPLTGGIWEQDWKPPGHFSLFLGIPLVVMNCLGSIDWDQECLSRAKPVSVYGGSSRSDG